MRLLTLLGLTLAAGCGSTIQLEVLQPAMVSTPAEVRVLAVVDRSKAKNVGQAVLGVLEGALTGEAIGADTEGRRESMRGMVETLTGSPRFDVVQPSLKNKDLESSLFDKTLSWPTARKICQMAKCDGIVTLEAFDSDKTDWYDESQVEETNSEGKTVTRTQWEVRREMRILTAWRYYDVKNKNILDDLRDHASARTWSHTGNTKAEAKRQLPPQTDMVKAVGYTSGIEYARRIAPTYVWVTRSFYGGGDPRLKQARTHVRATDWQGARKIWRTMVNDPDPKLKGKALFNIALSWEVEGDLDRALNKAKEAHIALGKGRTASYVATLNARIADQARLAEQLAPPPARPTPSPAPAPRERAMPEESGSGMGGGGSRPSDSDSGSGGGNSSGTLGGGGKRR